MGHKLLEAFGEPDERLPEEYATGRWRWDFPPFTITVQFDDDRDTAGFHVREGSEGESKSAGHGDISFLQGVFQRTKLKVSEYERCRHR